MCCLPSSVLHIAFKAAQGFRSCIQMLPCPFSPLFTRIECNVRSIFSQSFQACAAEGRSGEFLLARSTLPFTRYLCAVVGNARRSCIDCSRICAAAGLGSAYLSWPLVVPIRRISPCASAFDLRTRHRAPLSVLRSHRLGEAANEGPDLIWWPASGELSARGTSAANFSSNTCVAPSSMPGHNLAAR